MMLYDVDSIEKYKGPVGKTISNLGHGWRQSVDSQIGY